MCKGTTQLLNLQLLQPQKCNCNHRGEDFIPKKILMLKIILIETKLAIFQHQIVDFYICIILVYNVVFLLPKGKDL